MRNYCHLGFAATSLLLGLSAVAAGAATEIKIGADRRIRITDGWRFFKGEAAGAEQTAFKDTAWRALDLPHDWAIEGPFDRKFNPHDGGLPFFGVAWYRKHFTIPASAKGKYFSVQFDGAMSNSTVWINGEKVGGRPYGYESFALDLTPYLKFGEENVLAVRLAPEDQSSRWYPGAGIYRNVWLNVTGAVRVAQWGTYITTPSVTDTKATVAVRRRSRIRADRKRVSAGDNIPRRGREAGGRDKCVTLPPGGQTWNQYRSRRSASLGSRHSVSLQRGHHDP
jgi:beta-galactosidase